MLVIVAKITHSSFLIHSGLTFGFKNVKKLCHLNTKGWDRNFLMDSMANKLLTKGYEKTSEPFTRIAS